MAADPLIKLVSGLKKDLPEAVKKSGKALAVLPQYEKALKSKAKDYKKNLQKMMKALEEDKKVAKGDASASKEVERVKKMLKDDERKRLSVTSSGGSMPS